MLGKFRRSQWVGAGSNRGWWRTHEKECLVDLKPVSALPVASLLQKPLGTLNLRVRQQQVVKEQPDTQLGKQQIEPRPHCHRLRECLLNRWHGSTAGF
jgi:hypothetical protein